MPIIGKSRVGRVDGKLVVTINEKVAEKLGIGFGDEVTFTVDKDGNLAAKKTVNQRRVRSSGNTAGGGDRGSMFGSNEKVGLKKAAPKGTGRRGRAGGGNVRWGRLELPF